MKVGIRKPSIKRSIKARTTGRLKREIKKAYIPWYGKKGVGWVKNPKKALYNKVYHKTTVGVSDIARVALSDDMKSSKGQSKKDSKPSSNPKLGIFMIVAGIVLILMSLLLLIATIIPGIIGIAIGVICIIKGVKIKKGSNIPRDF